MFKLFSKHECTGALVASTLDLPMGSKLSKRPTPARLEKVVPVVPNIPPEILEEILDHLVARSGLKHLRSCSLVSKLWVPPCQRRLFYTITFTPKDVEGWFKTFPGPEKSPAHYVKDLCLLRGYYGAPEAFSEHILWFTRVERVTLLGPGWFRPLWSPSFVRLPQSTTSLTVKTDKIPLVQIRNVMVQLPNLNDLSLSGTSVWVDNNTPPGMGKTLRGRFSGKLRLEGHAGTDLMNMLLEVPTGLRFTEVEIRSTHECLLSTVRLAEACSRTLVKLSYAVSIYGKFHPFSWSSWF